MSKVTLRDVQNLQNEPSAVGTINSNFQALQSVIETLLSRDGAAPNQMLSLLDMNNRRIINLPPPIYPQEPARHGDIQQYVDQARDWAEYSEEQADRSETQADRSESNADKSEELLHEFQNTYLGVHAGDPLLDENGNVPPEGAIYFNTSVNRWRVFVHLSVFVDDEYVFVGVDPVEIHYWMDLPVTTLRSMADVSADFITSGQFLIWDGSNFVPFSLEAEDVPYSSAFLDADNVSDALDEVIEKTNLGQYDLAFFIEGLLAEGETIFSLVSMRRFVVPADTSLFQARARIGSTGTATIYLIKNGTQFGTLVFDESDSGVFSVPGDTTFNPGDVFSISSAAVVDDALRDVSIGIVARR